MYTVLFLNGYVGNVDEAFAYSSYTVKKSLAIFPFPPALVAQCVKGLLPR
jgi:hypothetical protein